MQERKYYRDLDYHPFLFYVIFGVSGEALQVSRSRHHVDEFPASLEMHSLNRRDHSFYIDGFFSGDLGNVLGAADFDLFETCRKQEHCVIIKGEINEDSSFDYMRNVIGFIEAFLESGASGVLDMMTFSLFSPAGFTGKFFEKEINALDHVVILFSKEEGGFWLHTRGMLKFGRPDFSMENVKKEEFNDCKEILDQMIFCGGEGVFFDGEYRLQTYSGKTFRVKSRFADDFENDDFNNAYCVVETINEE